MAEEKPTAKALKVKITPESIKMELFGDMMKFSKKNPREILPIKKYDTLAMALVSEERVERLMLYQFLCGLVISAHARRTNNQATRKGLFEIKNRLFLSIANNMEHRKVINFRFCVSKRFKVVEYCAECQEKNKDLGGNSRDWKFCNSCNIDRTYFNVLSMFHRHKAGGASLFLGKELLPLVEGLKPVKHVDLEDLSEEVTYRNYQFTPHNLIAVELASCISAANKLLVLAEKEKAKQPVFEARRPPFRRPGDRPFSTAPDQRTGDFRSHPRGPDERGFQDNHRDPRGFRGKDQRTTFERPRPYENRPEYTPNSVVGTPPPIEPVAAEIKNPSTP